MALTPNGAAMPIFGPFRLNYARIKLSKQAQNQYFWCTFELVHKFHPD